MRRFKVSVTTDGSGNAVAYSPRVTGKIHSIVYVRDGSNFYTNGVDFAITAEATGQNIWTQNDVNASVEVMPRGPTSSQAGVASLYAASGTAIQDKIAVSNDRVKFSLSSGGATKVGVFHVLVD